MNLRHRARALLGAPSRRGLALAATVLTLGLSAGAAGSVTLAAAARDAASADLALRTAAVRGAMDTTFQRYADTMHALAATATVRPALTARIAGDRLAGAQQVLVLGADFTVLAHHAADGTTPPPGPSAPPPPALARALELSRTTGRIVATPAHVLSPDQTLPPAYRQPAFELAAPVHDGTFRGWVVVCVRATDLLAASLRDLTGVSATLTQTAPDGTVREVATWPSGGTGPSRRVDVAPAGHAWQVVVRASTPPAVAVAAPLSLLGGALTGLLLAALVLGADRGRMRALAAARDTAAAQERAAVRADRAERALVERETELSAFAAAAGEHLHAPLHTIAGFTDLLLEDSLDEESRGFLDRIGRSTRRMLDVVDELLEYTGATDAAVKLEPVDVEHLARDLAAGIDRTGADRPAIDIGELPLVTADAALLRRLLDHLVGNALRFVRHGTPARVTIGARELPDGWWRIEIADRGIGIPADQRERIFAPFHRTPAAEGYPGTGLGLAVCKRIAALHGGEIGVEANPGGGSIFWFTVSASGVTLSLDDLTSLATA